MANAGFKKNKKTAAKDCFQEIITFLNASCWILLILKD